MSLIINKGNINDVVVTVTEQTTLSAPVNYLFEFIFQGTKAKYYFIAQNTSTRTGRFDEFSITEMTGGNPLIGQISLPQGDFIYNIYQQTSSTNLDPDLTAPSTFNAYVETGRGTVLSTATLPTQYTGSTISNTSYA